MKHGQSKSCMILTGSKLLYSHILHFVTMVMLRKSNEKERKEERE